MMNDHCDLPLGCLNQEDHGDYLCWPKCRSWEVAYSNIVQWPIALEETRRLCRKSVEEVLKMLEAAPWYRLIMNVSFVPKVLAHGVAQAMRY